MSSITWSGNQLIQRVGKSEGELGKVAWDGNSETAVLWLKDTGGVLGAQDAYIRAGRIRVHVRCEGEGGIRAVRLHCALSLDAEFREGPSHGCIGEQVGGDFLLNLTAMPNGTRYARGLSSNLNRYRPKSSGNGARVLSKERPSAYWSIWSRKSLGCSASSKRTVGLHGSVERRQRMNRYCNALTPAIRPLGGGGLWQVGLGTPVTASLSGGIEP